MIIFVYKIFKKDSKCSKLYSTLLKKFDYGGFLPFYTII